MAMSQLSCFSSIVNYHRLHLRTRSYPISIHFRTVKVLNVMSSDGRGTKLSNSQNITPSNYTEDQSESHNGRSVKSDPVKEEHVSEPLLEEAVSQPKRAAKIHDFCLGIPFGGLVLSGGFLAFLFSRNTAALSTGMLFGGAILALSILSLKVWGQGKSSLPFILGQAALAASLIWKNFQTYSLTKKIFPSGFNIFISAAMLCFYFYVAISGGNPPSKKLKSTAAVSS